jgi:hypothetical protein
VVLLVAGRVVVPSPMTVIMDVRLLHALNAPTVTLVLVLLVVTATKIYLRRSIYREWI